MGTKGRCVSTHAASGEHTDTLNIKREREIGGGGEKWCQKVGRTPFDADAGFCKIKRQVRIDVSTIRL